MYLKDCLLLAAELALYFLVLAGLFRLRATLGIGLLVTVLGTLHLLETYLAAVLYIATPGGFATSPGSAILFTGKLVLLLLVYIREDATAARQPIYGLLAGNFLIVALVGVIRFHDVLPLAAGAKPDLGFLDSMGLLMVWGTVLLYIDSILIVLLFERLGRALKGRMTARIFVAAALVLTFDQGAFFVGLKVIVGVPIAALYGGWFAKMAAAAGYAVLTGLYLRYVEVDREGRGVEHKLREVFEILTYRERYHALREQTGRDGLTNAFTRSRLETHGRKAVDLAVSSGQTVSVFVADIDRFKRVNDLYGHAAGDEVLRHVTTILDAETRTGDYLFRYGGDEFVLCVAGLTAGCAVKTAERLAERVATTLAPGIDGTVSISIGVATGPSEGEDYGSLFALADERLYAAKRMGQRRESSRDEAVLASDPSREAA